MSDREWAPPAPLADLAGIAELDHERYLRRGYAEAIYCEAKTTEQVQAISAAVGASRTPTLFTRASAGHAAAILAELPDAGYDAQARLVMWPAQEPEPTGGLVVVVAAGTSDLPVAREAQLVARHLGRRCELVVDVGVAGLHRVVGHLDLLRSAAALIVVAGMDGALPAVVAGLVSAPVVAVPTSVGYGAAFEGLAPCSPCSTRARRGWLWSTSTMDTALDTSLRRLQRHGHDERPACLARRQRGRRWGHAPRRTGGCRSSP